MKSSINIQFYGNSAFAIDFDPYFIVIDYFTKGLVIPKNRKVLFIVTHGHEDHYHPKIFQLKAAKNAKFILSDDVEACESKDNISYLHRIDKLKLSYDSKRVIRSRPNESFEVEGISFRTFGSTDQGVSIHFTVNGVHFFHSGDLNAWVWEDFSKEEQKKEWIDFQNIIQEVKHYPIDIAFGVVDSRLGKNGYLGPDFLLKQLRPQIFIPMHIKGDIQFAKKFQQDQKESFPGYLHVFERVLDNLKVEI